MAFISNYTTLKTAVSSLLDRPGTTTDEFDVWTQATEADIMRRVPWTRDLETTVTDTFVADQGYIDLPADCREPVFLWVKTQPPRQVKIQSLEEFQRADFHVYPPFTPYVAAVFGDRLLLAPAPGDEDYDLYYRTNGLDLTTTDPNFVLLNHADVYLYGLAVHAAPHLAEDDRLPTWAGFYENAIEGMKKQEWRRKLGGGPAIVKFDRGNP